MTDREPAIYMMSFAAFVAGMSLCGMMMSIFRNEAPPAPTSLTADLPWFQRNECETSEQDYGSMTCHLKLQPRKMTLEFVTRDQFDTMSAPPDAAAKYKIGGFARIHKTPCEIVVPIDDAELTSYPYRVGGMVNWVGKNYDMPSTLAHEILHCYAGRWHADSIAALQFRDGVESGRWLASYKLKVLRRHPKTKTDRSIVGFKASIRPDLTHLSFT